MRKTRLKRTDQLLREAVAELILKRVQDPRVGFVSVTGVQISPELDTARVFVTVLGDESSRKSAMEGLKSAAPFLQAELNKRVRLRRTPKLRFVYDESLDRGFRIEAALREVEDAHSGAEPASDEASDEVSDEASDEDEH
jgi:ribosome-binding factor A